MNRTFKSLLSATLIACAGLTTVSCSDDEPVYNDMLVMGEDVGVITLDEKDSATLSFTSKSVWKAYLKEPADWLTFSPEKGAGGLVTMKFSATSNRSKDPRSATLVIDALDDSREIIITQNSSGIIVLDPSEVKDLDKYYKPQEFSSMDMMSSESKWSWVRSRQSEHFFVFWEAGFGDDPNSEAVPAQLRVDIDDLLAKAEKFFDTNINKLKMARLGEGKSNLDKYKMEIYLLYQTEWLATGSGYDNTIGALWVNPSTCQPVGSTIAHEIGHSFQYQVYCDKIANGAPDDYRHGFRYGYDGSDGGCGYWEQCAQWQSFQDYPEEQFTSYNFDVWLNNCHRHFEHEWMRYASYWLQSYWVAKHGVEAYGAIWRESAYPDDAIQTYSKLYNNGNYDVTREELFDYAKRMATFDIEGIRQYAGNFQGRYSTRMLKNSEGAFQPVYANCPGATGFNVIPLNVPKGNATVSVDFKGLPLGTPLLPDDPGQMIDGDGKVLGTTSTYNVNGSDSDMGWRYGFVAYAAGTRTYSEVGKNREGKLSFNVPAGTEALYLVVQGSPETYRQSPWDEKEYTDFQYPYQVKFENTNLLGRFDIDENAEPSDVALTFTVAGDAGHEDYAIGTIDLGAQFDLAQAFVMTSDVMATKILPVGSTPEEGKIAVLNMEADGSLTSEGRANNGFWLDADGNNSSWGDNGFTFYEMNGTVLTYGHFPGHCEAGKTYQMRPTLVYTKNGKQYTAQITVNIKY